jgi:hypothetical protein
VPPYRREHNAALREAGMQRHCSMREHAANQLSA